MGVGHEKHHFNPEHHGLDELFTMGMENIVLPTARLPLFGSLVAILAPHLGKPMYEVTCTVADFG